MKKLFRMLCIYLAATLLLSCLAACDELKPDGGNGTTDQGKDIPDNSKTFTKNGMRIKLTNDFKEDDIEGYTSAYVDEQNVVLVFTLQEKFSLTEGFEDWTIKEYADAIKKNAPVTVATVKIENGITYFDYEFLNTELNTEYYYYTTVFKSNDSFWMIQFSCLAKDQAKMKPVFAEYAQTVSFD